MLKAHKILNTKILNPYGTDGMTSLNEMSFSFTSRAVRVVFRATVSRRIHELTSVSRFALSPKD